MTSKKRAPYRKHSKVSLLMPQAREIGAAQFKARCLELMDEVDRLGSEIVITKHRKPVARLVPAEAQSGQFVGCLKGIIIKMGDIMSPIDAEWTADESNLT